MKTVSISKILSILEVMSKEDNPLRIMDQITQIKAILVELNAEMFRRYHTSGEGPK